MRLISFFYNFAERKIILIGGKENLISMHNDRRSLVEHEQIILDPYI